MEIAQTIDKALYQYYTVENDLPVPNWRQIKDPEWWVQYLKDMGLDPRNRQWYNTSIMNSTSWTTNLIHQSGTVKDT